MKKLLCPLVVLFILLSANITHAQQTGSPDSAFGPAVQEIQKVDPQAAQAITKAIQQGDIQGAKKLYESFQKSQAQQAAIASVQTAAVEPTKSSLSLFEQAMPGNLRQFGYDIFNKTASSFAPPVTMSVGPDYIIGPGDQFTLTLWGTTEGIYNLQVSKEGDITLPKVGVVSVAGVRFGELERTLKRHLSKYYGNFNLSIAMGGLKTVTIYIVGEVTKPGSYSLSSLTTVYGALFAAGGPTKQGTLRAIQVLRTGKIIKTIDLYEFLLKGDRSQDIKLQNEDTVFVPLVGPVAGVGGSVYRPAIYELKGQESIGDVIQTAGGILPMALGGRLQLTRYEGNQKKVFLDIRLDEEQPNAAKSADTFREKVQNMDGINIIPVYDKVWETVSLSGNVEHPGEYQWRPDLKLREIIVQGQLLPRSDIKRADVIRITGDMIERKIIPVDLGALMAGDEAQNISLEPKDKIVIYNVDQNPSNVWETINLSGFVRNQGNLQWKPGLRVRDIIIQGELLPQSDMSRADVIRLNKNLVDRTVIPVDLGALMAGDEAQNILLEPQDQVRVYSKFKAAEKVSVSGEVVRAGEYEINKGERLSDLMRRVGGFTTEAYPYGAVFQRKGVRNAEAKNARLLISKIQSQIIQSAAAKTTTAVTAEEAQLARSEQALNQSMLDNLKAMQEMEEGRIAISITQNIDEWAGSKYDLLLQDGDSIIIPKRPQSVLILGEVHTPGAQIFLPGLAVKDYLGRTGGITRDADTDQIYVVQADGFSFGVDSPNIGNIYKVELSAGDAIFVPQKVDREATLRTTKDIIDIIFKAAVIFATIHLLF